MAWNRNTGRSNPGDNKGPWGNPTPANDPGRGTSPGGGRRGGGDRPPDLEDILRHSQDRLRRMLSRGSAGGPALAIGALIAVALWIVSGFYQVGPAKKGVVQRFGKYVSLTSPGLQWHVPWPIETAKVIDVQGVRRTAVGFDAEDGRSSAGSDQSLMLTSDRNFLNVKFLVQWNVNDARKFAFNVKEPETTVQTTAQSAMREVVGRGSFDQLQTGQRTATEEEVKRLLQLALINYDSGIQVLFVNLQAVDPPGQALEAARDVQTAGQEKETKRNQAEAYRNNVKPKALGEAQQILQGAQAYKQSVIADAEGEAARFLSVFEQYRKAPEVTRRRMYLETMENVLGGTNKVVIDRSAQGVIPYLPLPALNSAGVAQGAPQASAATANPPAGPAGAQGMSARGSQ